MTATTMVLQSIKRRLGWTIVLAVAAVAATLIMGNSWIAAVVAIVVVVLLGALIPSRGTRKQYPSERARGEPYSVVYRWKGDSKPTLEDLAQAMKLEGLTPSAENEPSRKLVLTRGSQLWSRLFGGYFVDPKRLPIQVELETKDAQGNGRCTVELVIRDRFGIAVRDEALEDRFALATTGVRSAVEARLTTLGAFEPDSAPHR